MKMDHKDSSLIYINAALTVSIILIVIFMIRPLFLPSDKNAKVVLRENNRPVILQGPSESIYDMDKVKRDISVSAGDSVEYSDLEEMYKNSDKTDVGGNMVEAWRRVKPEDKARLTDGFEQQIVVSKETLKKEPENKHAKNILYISEQLKIMSKSGFNYRLKNKKI